VLSRHSSGVLVKRYCINLLGENPIKSTARGVSFVRLLLWESTCKIDLTSVLLSGDINGFMPLVPDTY
jgi:hypothetical protein